LNVFLRIRVGVGWHADCCVNDSCDTAIRRFGNELFLGYQGGYSWDTKVEGAFFWTINRISGHALEADNAQ
jgi:hypothetical protein